MVGARCGSTKQPHSEIGKNERDVLAGEINANADALIPIAHREIAAQTRVTPVLYVMTPL